VVDPINPESIPDRGRHEVASFLRTQLARGAAVSVGNELLDTDRRIPHAAGAVLRRRSDSSAVRRPRNGFNTS
jgi:hypothetical protein